MVQNMLGFWASAVMMLTLSIYDTAAIMLMFKPRIGKTAAAMLLFTTSVLLFFPASFEAGNPEHYLVTSVIFGIISTLANFYFLWLCFEGRFWEKVLWLTLRDILDPILFSTMLFGHFFPGVNFTDALPRSGEELLLIIFMELFGLLLRCGVAFLLAYVHRKMTMTRELEKAMGIVGMLAYAATTFFLLQRLFSRESFSRGDAVVPFLLYSLCIAVAVKIIFDTLENHKLSLEVSELAEQKQAQYDLFMARLSADEETRRLHHDIKGHVAVVQTLLQNQEYDRAERYLEELSLQQAALPVDPPRMENAVAGALIADKYLRCRKEQIAFSVDGGIGRDIGTSDVDLVCLLSNLLDNAIEACLQVEPEKRRINVKFTQRAGCLFIREENSKRSGSVIKEGQLTGTTKADTASHGYGARIMRDVVDRCDGTVELQETDDTFTAIVMLRPVTEELQPRASLTAGR